MTSGNATAGTAEIAERRLFLFCVLCALCGCVPLVLRPLVVAQPRAPIVVVETAKGTFTFETYPDDAPKSVAHVVELVRNGFYDGQRVHRALSGFLVQWGDPRSRDTALERDWGRGAGASSGTPIGAVELSKKRTHTRGAVALAHTGNPAQADSQIYVTLANRPELNGRYTVIGHLIDGDEVPARLERGDLILRMFVRE
ncbi:MAG TPA: peptidylprolyl isomerase [Vicinamibacterales bacterium]|nr:peptidylprolyl isomerase [Vicinamibacterales bacterium]